MNYSGELSRPFPKMEMPNNSIELNTHLVFQVKVTDNDFIYDLKARLCIDG